jgi:signal transduction histidine kinase
MKPVRGDSTHALLNEVASESIRYFFACPLIIAGQGHGALGVYVEKSGINRKHDRFLVKDKVFIELCAGLIADRLNSAQTADRLARCENLLEELRANLTREQETARVGARAVDHYNTLASEIQTLRELVHSRLTYQKRIQQAKVILDELETEQAVRQRELATMKFSLKITDLFAVVREVVDSWKEKSSVNGVEITTRIPQRGPSLLMNESKVKLALGNILRTLTSCVRDGDKVMVECSTNASRAMVAIADTGAGLPGNLLSRLFMPFSDLDQNDEFKSAMSLAGDILHHHAGEIMIKSSTSWKTILVVSFPMVANKDRRRVRSERRNRSERRTPPKGEQKQNQPK